MDLIHIVILILFAYVVVCATDRPSLGIPGENPWLPWMKRKHELIPLIDMSILDHTIVKSQIESVVSQIQNASPSLSTIVSAKASTLPAMYQRVSTATMHYISPFIEDIADLINVTQFFIDAMGISQSEKWTIVYLPLDLPRPYWDGRSTITHEQVNSGMAVYGKKTIYIWRKQEFQKVLLHELFHAFELDHQSSYPSGNFLFEGVTEFWAIVLYSIYRSPRQEDIQAIWESQMSWSREQAEKLVGVLSTTFVYEYYVFKFLIMQDMNMFSPGKAIQYQDVAHLANRTISKVRTDSPLCLQMSFI